MVHQTSKKDKQALQEVKSRHPQAGTIQYTEIHQTVPLIGSLEQQQQDQQLSPFPQETQLQQLSQQQLQQLSQQQLQQLSQQQLQLSQQQLQQLSQQQLQQLSQQQLQQLSQQQLQQLSQQQLLELGQQEQQQQQDQELTVPEDGSEQQAGKHGGKKDKNGRPVSRAKTALTTHKDVTDDQLNTQVSLFSIVIQSINKFSCSSVNFLQFTYLLINSSMCLSIHPSICPSIHPPVRLSIHRSIHPPVHPFTHSSIHSGFVPSQIQMSR